MQRRLDDLERQPFDVLILGGGITGAGVALDAVLRGLRVALIDGLFDRRAIPLRVVAEQRERQVERLLQPDAAVARRALGVCEQAPRRCIDWRACALARSAGRYRTTTRRPRCCPCRGPLATSP